MANEVPDKQYLKIGEVAKLISLNSSVLRYWETEFDQLRPLKSRTGQRMYSRNDLEIVCRIKQLLYGEKLTIAGARKKLSREAAKSRGCTEEETKAAEKAESVIYEVIEELKNIRDSL